ncbi:MAG: hypothetical protein A2046_07385 [Bacteroidetes bacterium GWA2_30_7]|nr:MAG: hypothetical protein A2046_07385 [Bacteroidetes bacterium GWA2_30_7]
MNINRDNYEQYFIDYYDENLSKSQIDELFIFLEANVDAKNEFFAYSQEIILIPENISFDAKNQLKQITNDTVISKDNFEKFCVAQIEDDLNKHQQLEFEQFVNTQEIYLKEYNLYKKTILKVDENIVFNHKHELKHYAINKIKPSRIYWFASAIAASILLYFMLKINNNEPEKILSNNSNNIKIEKPDSVTNNIHINNQIADNKIIAGKTKSVIIRKKENIQKIPTINNFSEKAMVLAKSIDFVAVETEFVVNEGNKEKIAENTENTEINSKPIVKKTEPQTIWDLAQKSVVKFLKNRKLPIKTTFDKNDNLHEIALNTKYLSIEHVFEKK